MTSRLREARHRRPALADVRRMGAGLLAIGAIRLVPRREQNDTARIVREYFREGA